MLEENIQKILDNFMIDYYGVADISGYESKIVKYEIRDKAKLYKSMIY